MRLGKYIPKLDDCIDIHITKNTWVWIQNNTHYEFGDKVTDFCVELHHTNDYETMVDSDFLSLIGNESKKDIIEKAIDKALEVLPQLYYTERDKNPKYANHIYETVSDIWFGTKQFKTKGELATYMYKHKKDY